MVRMILMDNSKYVRSRSATNKCRKGAHAVEFAVVLPIMLLLFVAGIEFARMNMLRHLAENASYEAARHIMVPGATVAEAEAKASSILGVMGVSGLNVTVAPNPVLESTEKVSVTVSFPANDNMWMAPVFSNNLSFVAETTLLTERSPMQQIDAITGPPPPAPSSPPESTTTPEPAPPPEPLAQSEPPSPSSIEGL